MGTNYYYIKKSCPTCGHSDHREHIGKSSYGWQFSFQSTYENKSWRDWQKELQSGEGDIFDEYGDVISFGDFKKLVEDKQADKDNRNHAADYPDQYSWIDPEGYSFSERDFS